MGKIARFLTLALGLLASIAGGSVGDLGVEQGDEIARGERAVAVLGCLLLGCAIISTAIVVDIFVHPFLTVNLMTGIGLLAVFVPVGVCFRRDRRIAKMEQPCTSPPEARKDPDPAS